MFTKNFFRKKSNPKGIRAPQNIGIPENPNTIARLTQSAITMPEVRLPLMDTDPKPDLSPDNTEPVRFGYACSTNYRQGEGSQRKNTLAHAQ